MRGMAQAQILLLSLDAELPTLFERLPLRKRTNLSFGQFGRFSRASGLRRVLPEQEQVPVAGWYATKKTKTRKKELS